MYGVDELRMAATPPVYCIAGWAFCEEFRPGG